MIFFLDERIKMSDSETAKNQLREHLSSLIIPRISQGFWSIYESAQKLCEQNKQPGETLRTFQNLLTKIPQWTETTISEEVERILKVSKCPYMDDLLMGVFLAYMKAFASLQYNGSASQVKVDFERPNVSKFIHELYNHSARKLWQVAYLFKTSISTEQQAKNRQEIEQIIHRSLDDVIRGFLPWEVIAKAYFTESTETPATKSVVFEDVPEQESDSESESEAEAEAEEKPRSLSLGDELDFSVLGIEDDEQDEKDEVKEVKFEEIDPLEEIESKIGKETLVLNL